MSLTNTNTVPGDGSCFFHAVLNALPHTFTFPEGKKLKKMLKHQNGRDFHADMMQELYDAYKKERMTMTTNKEKKERDRQFAVNREGVTPADYNRMIREIRSTEKGKMLQLQHFATIPEIQKTSDFIGRDIYIIYEFDSNTYKKGEVLHIEPGRENPEPRTGSPIYLRYTGANGTEGCHYNSHNQLTHDISHIWKHEFCFFDAVVSGLPYTDTPKLKVGSASELMNAVMQTMENYHDRFHIARAPSNKTSVETMINNAIHETTYNDKILEATEDILGRHIAVYESREPYVKRRVVTHRGSPIVLKKTVVSKTECGYELDIEQTQHWSLYGALSTITPKQNIRNPILLYQHTFKQYRQHAIPIIWRRLDSEEVRRLSRMIGKNITIFNARKNKTLFQSHIDDAWDTIYITLNTRYTLLEKNMLPKSIPKTLKNVQFRNTPDVRYIHTTQQEANTLGDIISNVVSISGNVPNIHSSEGILPVPNKNAGEGPHTVSESNGEQLNSVKNNGEILDNVTTNNGHEVPHEVPHEVQHDVPHKVPQELDRVMQWVQNHASDAHTPQEQRKVDIGMDAVVKKLAEYLLKHHPEMIPQIMVQAQTSPGLFRKFAKYLKSNLGPRVGRHAKGVVDRSTVGDWGILGLAVSIGIPMVSSYLSFWRAFTG
jgi:hypothetical protein